LRICCARAPVNGLHTRVPLAALCALH
jgi:hypothetical protein